MDGDGGLARPALLVADDDDTRFGHAFFPSFRPTRRLSMKD
jgi:hypothetical protein